MERTIKTRLFDAAGYVRNRIADRWTDFAALYVEIRAVHFVGLLFAIWAAGFVLGCAVNSAEPLRVVKVQSSAVSFVPAATEGVPSTAPDVAPGEPSPEFIASTAKAIELATPPVLVSPPVEVTRAKCKPTAARAKPKRVKPVATVRDPKRG